MLAQGTKRTLRVFGSRQPLVHRHEAIARPGNQHFRRFVLRPRHLEAAGQFPLELPIDRVCPWLDAHRVFLSRLKRSMTHGAKQGSRLPEIDRKLLDIAP